MAKNQNNNVAPATQKTEPGAKKDALATALAPRTARSFPLPRPGLQ